MSLLVCITFFFLRKKGISAYYLYPIIMFIFLITLILSINNLLFFFNNNPNEILLNLDSYLLYILIFNVSIIIFGSSIIPYINFSLRNIENKGKFLNSPKNFNLYKRKECIKTGKIEQFLGLNKVFYSSLDDLEKHMFICGSTGTGKSNFMQYYLLNLREKFEIPFFLVEFKGEYHFLQKKIEDLLILWPGENFSINIFNPEGTDPFIHAERIFDILKSGKFFEDYSEFSPQMEKVLIEILVECCSSPQSQNWEGFRNCSKKYLEKEQFNIPMLKQTLIGVNNRIRRYSQGPLKAIFQSNQSIKMNKLFDINIILDLSSIIRLGGEKEDALFFLNMILKYLWDRNLTSRAKQIGIKHITIIEDAQYFAPQGLVNKSKLTTYLEDIALLQRGTGECLVTIATRPDISKEILANNGIVLTFKNHIEKDIMCDLLNLNVEKKSLLSSLNKGECIIRVNSIQEPFLLKIPLIKREILTVQEINMLNNVIFSKISNSLKNQETDRKSILNIKNGEENNLEQHDYQKFSELIKNLYDQEREKFLESKEHS